MQSLRFKKLCVLLCLVSHHLCVQAQDIELLLKTVDCKPHARQLAWQENEFIAVIHFSSNTFTEREWGSGNEDQKLSDAVTGSLKLAVELDLKSIAIPAISTGIFGFPKKRGARIIYQAMLDYFSNFPESQLADVRMIVYDQPTTQAFMKMWSEVFEG